MTELCASRRQSLSRVLVAAAVCVLAAPASAQPVAETAAYLCRIGQAPRRLASAPQQPPAEELASLRQWDMVAVNTIARAVRGETPLVAAADMFLALLNAGPFAGAFRDASAPPDPFLEIRGRRFLDAASRLQSGMPADLIRQFLSDGELVRELQADDSGSARRAGHFYFARRLAAGADQSALMRLIPALTATRGHVSDPELVARCMEQLDRGQATSALADLLARTLLWDARLYLLHRPSPESLQEALALEDGALEAEFRQIVSEMHLRYFLLGAHERKETARAWEQLDARGFIRRYPEEAWVGYAAALCRELYRGTVLVVRGEPTPRLLRTGNTVPLTYTVAPGEVVTFARLSLPRDGLPPGVQMPDAPDAVEHPAPISGLPSPAGLRFTVVFTRPGATALPAGVEIAGIPLPGLSHPVQVADPDADPAPSSPTPDRKGLQLLTVQVPVALPGYEAFADPTQAAGITLQGVRKFTPLADGKHGMEHQVLYEVRMSQEDSLPPEVMHCDQNPGTDPAAREQVLAQALESVALPLGEGFTLAPNRARVAGRDCWVGKRGKGQDGQYYYVLCRGRQQYYTRNDAFMYRTFWDPLIGEMPVYDARQVQADTQAVAEAVLGSLRLVGGAEGPGIAGVGPIARGRALEFLDEARSLLDTDADMVRRLDLTAATWKQKRLENQGTADTVAADIVSGYDTLSARVEALQPGDDALAALMDGLKAVLGIGVAASRLVEKGMRAGDGEKVDLGMALLHGHDTERQRLRTQSMALKLEYAQR